MNEILVVIAAVVGVGVSIFTLLKLIDELLSGPRLHKLEGVLRDNQPLLVEGGGGDKAVARLHRITVARIIARELVPASKFFWPLAALAVLAILNGAIIADVLWGSTPYLLLILVSTTTFAVIPIMHWINLLRRRSLVERSYRESEGVLHSRFLGLVYRSSFWWAVGCATLTFLALNGYLAEFLGHQILQGASPIRQRLGVMRIATALTGVTAVMTWLFFRKLIIEDKARTYEQPTADNPDLLAPVRDLF